MRDTRTEARLASPRGPGIGPSRFPRPVVGAGGLALIALAAVLVALLVSGGQRVIPAHVAGVKGSAQLRVAGGRGQLIVRGLTAPPSGDVYQVWLEPPHSPPLPTRVLFTIASGGSADLTLPGSLAGISRVLVTPEPPGGSLAPTHAPVIVARVS